MSKHILYYSTKCRFCQAFLEELRTTPFMREFTFVCVDPSPSRPPLPRWLKSVPSMVPAGAAEPLVGPGPVNNWLFERPLGGGGAVSDAASRTAARNMPLAQPVYSPDVAPRPTVAAPARPVGPPPASGGGSSSSAASGPDGPAAYHAAEMSSGKLSDAYSFLGSAEATSDKMYNPIVRNFELLVGVPGIPGMGGAGGSSKPPEPKRSPKEERLLKEMEAYAAARDSEIPGPPTRR